MCSASFNFHIKKSVSQDTLCHIFLHQNTKYLPTFLFSAIMGKYSKKETKHEEKNPCILIIFISLILFRLC